MTSSLAHGYQNRVGESYVSCPTGGRIFENIVHLRISFPKHKLTMLQDLVAKTTMLEVKNSLMYDGNYLLRLGLRQIRSGYIDLGATHIFT